MRGHPAIHPSNLAPIDGVIWHLRRVGAAGAG